MEPFPDDVKKFLYENVESIDQLEVLRLLGEDRGKEWPLAELAVAVQTTPQALRAHLAAMQARGLLTTEQRGTDLLCRFGVGPTASEVMVNRLLQLYKERPVTMIKLVYERPADPLRDFADAFRVRKED